mgnify:FL=1
MIGRELIALERASANYALRQVRQRRTGNLSWEVVAAKSGEAVATGLPSRAEALRQARAWERLHERLDDGLEGHVRVH